MALKEFTTKNSKTSFAQHKYLTGFTLIELIIYIAIVAGVITSLILYSISISDSREKSFVAQTVQSNARMALTLIAQKIRAANGVNTSLSVFDIDPGYLSLSYGAAGSNPTAIGLNQDDGLLEIKEGASAPSIIISDLVRVTDLRFTRLTSAGTQETIKIYMTIEYNSDTESPIYEYSQSFETTVRVRN
jgi:type II secretory pathway pseudopilin PulG